MLSVLALNSRLAPVLLRLLSVMPPALPATRPTFPTGPRLATEIFPVVDTLRLRVPRSSAPSLPMKTLPERYGVPVMPTGYVGGKVAVVLPPIVMLDWLWKRESGAAEELVAPAATEPVVALAPVALAPAASVK